MSYSSDLSDGLPLLFFLVRFQHRIPQQWRPLFIGHFISFPVKLLTIGMSEYKLNTLPFYHLLAVVEMASLGLLYQRFIEGRLKAVVKAMLPAILFFNVVNSLFIQNIWSFNTYAWTINTMALIVFGMLYLFSLYEKIEEMEFHRHPGFLFNAGVLIYAGGSLFTYSLSLEIFSREAVGFFHNGWLIQCVANIIKNAFLTYAIWRIPNHLATRSYS